MITRELGRRDPLPEAALAAMLDHPDPRVRMAVVDNASVDPRIRIRGLDDPNPAVRRHTAATTGLPVPDTALVLLVRPLERWLERGLISDAELFPEIEEMVARDRRLTRVLVRHPSERIRLATCSFGARLDDAGRAALLADPSPAVRAAIAERLAADARPLTEADVAEVRGMRRGSVLQGRLSPEPIDTLLAGDADDARSLAFNRHLPPRAVAALIAHPDATARRYTARRDDLTVEQVLRLAADPDPEVRAAVSVHPVLTEDQRATIVLHPDAAKGHACVCERDPRPEPEPGPGDVERWARSVNPLLRVRAARRADLPADLVAVLADDPDEGVRTELAVHNPAAPARLMMPAYLSQRRCNRKRLRDRPGFPAAGLARHAGRADPGLRVLALLDPAAGPELLESLLTDPDKNVREATARSPRLPAGRIVALLEHPDLGPAAAANPALPVTAMDRLAGPVTGPCR